MKELLKTLIDEQDNIFDRELIHRDLELPDIENKIFAIIGMRRVGKSSYLFQKIKELRESGVDKDTILYLNFEDERLGEFNDKSLGLLLDMFFRIVPKAHDLGAHFFLDEIQNVVGWEKTVNRFHNYFKHKIYISGSSAKMLSKEIATSLRGRSLALEIWPYCFSEYEQAISEYLISNLEYKRVQGNIAE